MQYFVRRPCVLQTSVEGTVQARRPSRCEAKMCAGNARRSEAAKTDTLSISSCLNEFVAGSEHRLRIFGKFD